MLASLVSDFRRWEFGEREVLIRMAEEGVAQLIPESDRQLLVQLLSEAAGGPIQVGFGEEWKHSLQPKKANRRAEPAQAASAVVDDARSDVEVQEFEKLFGKSVTGIRQWKG
jgi:hypothetical protein